MCRFAEVLLYLPTFSNDTLPNSHAIDRLHEETLLVWHTIPCIQKMAQSDQVNDGAHQPLLVDHREPEYGGVTDENHVTGEPSAPAQGTFKRNLGTIEAFAIVISIVIGSGVFTSPGSIDANVPSPGAALLIWLVGGVLAWTGAATLAELGTAIPGEGLLRQYSYNWTK